MSDKPTCWKCGEELRYSTASSTNHWRCHPCDLDMDDREAFNPKIAKAHHEEAEKGPEAKQLSPERIEQIVAAFETARVASATMKKLFPMLFDQPSLHNMPDPVAMGLMAGELMGHAIWLTQELNKEHRWRVKREEQLRCAVAMADLGRDGKGYLLGVDEANRIVDVIEYGTTGAERKPNKRELMPMDEYEARAAAQEKAQAEQSQKAAN